MAATFLLSDYVEAAMRAAEYDKLDDGSFAGRIPDCPGAMAFGGSLRSCEDELRSVFEEWLVLGLRLNHQLPVLAGIDLNATPGPGDVGAL